jgi:NADH-quinone oxidoreductase subunit C
MSQSQALVEQLQARLGTLIDHIDMQSDMPTIELSRHNLIAACTILREESPFNFESLVDVCGVDYFNYGVSEWRTEETTESGFSRGRRDSVRHVAEQIVAWNKPRFAAVYHLLSLSKNQRVRLKVYMADEPPTVPSVIQIWPSANWYEREAFDLFGIIFEGHPDLRRLLTDYGFVGHPFRKDFPLIGEVELRYDAAQQRCVYEPVSIQPRVLVPKVIRLDNRYTKGAAGTPELSEKK